MLSIVAVPPDNSSIANVSSSVDVKTLTTVVSDASSVASIELDWLRFLSSPSSDNSWSTDSVSISTLVGEDPVSVVSRSNGVGS